MKIESSFEEQLLENFHNSQSSFNKTIAPRRDMLGLAQWLDKTSEEIFGFIKFYIIHIKLKFPKLSKILRPKNNS